MGKELITSKIEEVRYNGGHSTRKPSTVTMAVPHKFAVQVADLIEEYEKQGIEPEEGLIRLELVAHYADDKEFEDIIDHLNEDDHADDAEEGTMDQPDETEPEQIIEDLTEKVDEALEDDLDTIEEDTEIEEPTDG